MVTEAQFSKQDHVKIAIVEPLLVQYLTLVQVYDLAEIEDRFDDIQVELAEDWMVIM